MGSKTMGQGAILLFLVAFVYLVQYLGGFEASYSDATYILGASILIGYLAGKIASVVKLPAITGYLIVGLFLGPELPEILWGKKGIVSMESMETLSLINQIALGLIAFTAGGELKIEALRGKVFSLVGTALVQLFGVLTGVFLVMAGLFYLFPLGQGSWVATILVPALLIGCTATAISPATTIAVIKECRARGEMTTAVLAITVLKDVLVIALFAVVFSVSLLLVRSGSEVNGGVGGILLWELLGSLAVGIFLGWLMSRYIEHINKDLPLLVVALGFLSVELGQEFHLSGLLICIAAGFYVENRSNHGKKLLRALELYSLPVFIIFFAFSGASIDIKALREIWPMALSLVIARVVFTWLSTSLGLKLVGGESNLVKYTWSGCIGQAGVTLGFAAVIAQSLPEMGAKLSTLIIAAVGINQVLGPVLFRWGLIKAGEMGMERRDEGTNR